MDFRFALPFAATSIAVIGAIIYWFSRGSKSMEGHATEDLDLKTTEHSDQRSGNLSGKPIESKHYAWAKDIKVREAEMKALGVDMSPKPILVSDAVSPVPIPVPATGTSRSAWNAAGTWEDRDITARALHSLRTRLEGFSNNSTSGTFAVTAVTSCQGTVSLM